MESFYSVGRLYKDLGDGQSIIMVRFLMQPYILDIIKTNGYNFWGNRSTICIFASLFNGGQLFEERICSPQSRFLLLRVDSLLKGLGPRESKQKATKIVPLCKNGQIQEDVPIHNKMNGYT